jgi:low temperature requirement protein LtrA
VRIAVSREPGAERVVTPLELFFDLAYVFAIGQLAHHLLEHVDLRTGAETVILALAVGDEMAIVHPEDEATLGFTIVAFGGPALFLLAQWVFHRGALGHVAVVDTVRTEAGQRAYRLAVPDEAEA